MALEGTKQKETLTILRLTMAKGRSIRSRDSLRHARAFRLNPAPGIQAGTCFTVNVTNISFKLPAKRTSEQAPRPTHPDASSKPSRSQKKYACEKDVEAKHRRTLTHGHKVDKE